MDEFEAIARLAAFVESRTELNPPRGDTTSDMGRQRFTTGLNVEWFDPNDTTRLKRAWINTDDKQNSIGFYFSGKSEQPISYGAKPLAKSVVQKKYPPIPAQQSPGNLAMLRALGENDLNGLASGYVLNFYSSPQGQYWNTIHPFDCPHIGRMTNPPRKNWADTVAELEA